MFKVVKDLATIGTKVYCELYATTKEEVVVGATIIGLPAGRSLASGSWGFTHDGDLFIYDETNGFKFVGDEDSSAKSAPMLTRPILEEGLKKSISDESEEEPIIEEEEPEIEEKAVKE